MMDELVLAQKGFGRSKMKFWTEMGDTGSGTSVACKRGFQIRHCLMTRCV